MLRVSLEESVADACPTGISSVADACPTGISHAHTALVGGVAAGTGTASAESGLSEESESKSFLTCANPLDSSRGIEDEALLCLPSDFSLLSGNENMDLTLVSDSFRVELGVSGNAEAPNKLSSPEESSTGMGLSEAVSYTHLTLPTICSV